MPQITYLLSYTTMQLRHPVRIEMHGSRILCSPRSYVGGQIRDGKRARAHANQSSRERWKIFGRLLMSWIIYTLSSFLRPRIMHILCFYNISTPRTKKSTTQSLFTSESCLSASKILSCASLRPAPLAVLFFVRGVDIIMCTGNEEDLKDSLHSSIRFPCYMLQQNRYWVFQR